MLDFGTPLVKCRRQARLSLEATADRLGISRTTYHNWESNHAPYKVDFLPRLADVFGVELTELLPADLKVTMHKAQSEGVGLTFDTQALYETLVKSQSLNIQLLEAENQRLKADRALPLPPTGAGHSDRPKTPLPGE